MRRLPLLVAVFAIVPASVSSCANLFPFAPDNLCESRIRAQCGFAFRCCNANERLSITFSQGGGVATQAFFSDYRSEGDCVEDLLTRQGACAAGQAVKESIDEGRFEYDQELAETCNKPLLDALNNCESEVVFDPAELDVDDECRELTGPEAYGVGLVGDGDPCFAAYECEDEGAICFFKPEEDDDQRLITSVGECKAPAKEGQDCSEDFLCEPGTACDGSECVELLNNGDPCFSNFECKSDFCDPTDGECAPVPDPSDDVKTTVEVCNGNDADDTDF